MVCFATMKFTFRLLCVLSLLMDEDSLSHVAGCVVDGLFDGHIELRDGTRFNIERSSKYGDSSGETNHSIVYRDKDVKFPAENHSAQRRVLRAVAETDSNGLYKGRICSVAFDVDHLLYQEFMRKEARGIEKRYGKETKENAKKRLNQSLYKLSWRQQIHTNDNCTVNRFCDPHLDAYNFLSAQSVGDHTKACIAFGLTYRDFKAQTVGLAHMKTVCDTTKFTTFSKNNSDEITTTNTGIITFKNSGKRLVPLAVNTAFTHEVGHLFGSWHDFSEENPKCTPNGDEGNFLMYYLNNDITRKNTQKFSPCSIRNITENLHFLLKLKPRAKLNLTGAWYEEKKTNCFTENEEPVCGNGIVEKNEQCDCGMDKDECLVNGDASCCHPGDSPGKIGCTFTKNSVCSPISGPCCSFCSFAPKLANLTCATGVDCKLDQVCDGRGGTCPAQRPAKDTTSCRESTMVCEAGECKKSICEHYGFKSCLLSSDEADVVGQCHMACSVNGSCKSSLDIAVFRVGFRQAGRVGQRGLVLPAGSPCNPMNGNPTGICDVYRRCRLVYPDGTYRKVMEAFKFFEQSALPFIREKWWVILIVAICFVLLTGLLVKFCAVYTPSQNPNLRKARNFRKDIPLARKPQSARISKKKEDKRVTIISNPAMEKKMSLD